MQERDTMREFADLSLERNSPLPAYYQIQAYIEKLIREKRIIPGDRLPSEREFVSVFPVSRMTYRQTLGELAQLGLLVRRQGSGTYVAYPKIGSSPMQVTSFSENMAGSGLRAGARTLKKQRFARPLPDVAAALMLPADHPVIYLSRIRLADDRPVVLEQSWLDAVLYESLLTIDLTDRSLYRVLKEQFDITITRRSESIEAALCDEKLSRKLGIYAGAPLLKTVGTGYDGQGRPVEYTVSHYRGDLYRFTVTGYRELSGE
ncbi:MAG: GntR family transcriptional regulator [Clostridiales bacterium]|nr:GntR family transcriptional regulator [Clostridiales bacterium]